VALSFSQYQKSLKLSGKCYIDTVIRNIQTILRKEEKWMGMWLLILRSACVAKKYELWFIVNGYPPNHERLGGTTFMNKYFEGKMVTYADLEKRMLSMKSKPSRDRLKMAAMYFLASILIGSRKSGEGASPVDSFIQTIVDDLDPCIKFPWGRYAFEHNLKDVSSFLEKCDGLCRRVRFLITSFPIPLEVFLSSLRWAR
ncbi:hypothetical protein BRARA_J00620, partial [Brassica rapa]